MRGRYISEFDELCLIAHGNYGLIYKVKCKTSEELFAIKRVPFNKSKNNFENFEMISKLDSTFVVKHFNSWIEDNNIDIDFHIREGKLNPKLDVFKQNKPFLLHIQMEYFSLNLEDLIKELNDELNQNYLKAMTPLGYYISSELFVEILECVNYLHTQSPSIIHRDLKPRNILITDGKNGRFIKLCDFGLATTHYDEQSHTEGSGTYRYMALEVLRGRRYNTKADIYSLGIMGLELFNIDFNE